METSGKDSSSLAQPIPEIRIRKGSDVPSISESEAEQEGYAPLAYDEGLSDLDENVSDSEKDHWHGECFAEGARTDSTLASGVISPTLQLNLSSPDDAPPVWNDGGSAKNDEGGTEKAQDQPRPPRPATTPTKPPPPRPPQMKSPEHKGLKKEPPSRPSQPPKSPVKTPSGGMHAHSVNQIEDDFGISGNAVDYLAEDRKSAQDQEIKPSYTPLTDYRETDSATPPNADQEKIKITLPKSAKAKSAKKQFNTTTQEGQAEADRVLTPPPGKRHAPVPPPPPTIVKTRPVRPPLPPPPSKAAPEQVVSLAEPDTKSTWEVFDDGPLYEEKTTEDEATEAGATSNDDDENDPFPIKPADGGDSTSHATNSFDDESKLCDPSSPTEKKSHKYKGIGTKRLRSFLDPKKGKNTTKKEKKHRVKDKEFFSKFLTDECKDVNEKSSEFLAFQQMQDRIKQTVKTSQEKITKHKMEFEDELHKLATSADNSPWFIVPPDGTAPAEEDVKADDKPDPKALWDAFDDDFDTVPNPEVTKNLHEASGSPSPNPVPPYNSRCASNEQLSEMANANGEADLLGLGQGGTNVTQTDGLGSGLSGLDSVTGTETLNVDILSLSRNPIESNKSSGRSSPSALEANMAALVIITEDATDAHEIGGSLVDDFLGFTTDVKSVNSTVTSSGNVMDILGFDDEDKTHEKQLAATSNHENLLGGITPTETPGEQIPSVVLLDSETSAFSVSVSNDDIFGLGAKKETKITSVKSGENLFSFGEDAFDTEKYKQLDVGVDKTDASVLPNDEFDPRADFDTLDAKPITDENVDMWGSMTAKPKNPFTSGDVDEPAVTLSSSVNPFATKNPFLSSDAGDEIPFADGEAGVNIFNDTTPEPSGDVGGFNPFATITDDSAGADESAFDPFQTIHDDDAFEVHFPDETETTEKKEEDGATSPPRFNPFNKEPAVEEKFADFKPAVAEETSHSTTEYSTEEEDENAEPFLPFHEKFEEVGWKMLQRQPTKKKLTQNRYWKEVYVKLVKLNDVPILKVYKNEECKECIHELGLQYSYTLCNLGLQQFDQYGKCHTVKIQYVFYRERVGVKGERIAPTFSDLTRVRDFKGLRDLVHKPKATMILDHVPQASELIKFGGLNYKDFCSFIWEVEDALFHLPAPREKPLTYTKDEITVDIVDEYVLHLDKDGHIGFNKARVRIFCLAFLTGDKPTVEIGINDKWRQGKEVVRRQDIIPIKTDEWIRIYEPEFHSCVQMDEYEKTHVIQLLPPDACHFEVMRFRVRPRLNKELPLQIHCSMSVVDRHVEMRAEILIPGYYSNSRKALQTPCEDIQVRFPIPDPWIYMFRVEKRFRYGSVRSTTRKAGKIKGLERLTMMAQGMLPSSLIEVSSGVAKYEHVYHNIIWRINRLPERNEGAYKTHMFTMKLDLGPHDAIPDTYDKDVFVEFVMPNSTVSRAQVRSISIDTDTSPDKWVHHLAKYEYKVEMKFTDKPFTELCPEKDMMFPVTLEGKEKPKDTPQEEPTRRASLAEKEDDNDSDSSSTDSD